MLFFKGLVLLILELYMEYLIYVYFHAFGSNFNDEQVFVWLASIVMFLLLPLIYFRVLASEPEILQSTRRLWGQLYYEVDIYSRSSLAFYVIFIIRRIVFVIVCFGLSQDSPGIAIILLILLNTIVLLYVAHIKPITDKLKNRLEIFNEYMVSIITIQMIWFTDYVGPNLKHIQWSYGYVVNVFVAYYIYVNINIFFYFAVMQLI